MSIDIISELKPKNNAEFALLDDQYLRGGVRVCADLTTRNAIPVDKRKYGMKVFVQATDLTYKLQSDLVTWILDESSAPAFVEIAFSYGDATPRTIYTAIKTQRIWQVILSIDVAFNGSLPSITLGDNGDLDRLMASNQNDPLTIGVYSTSPAYEYAEGSAILLSITPGGGASAGSGKIQLLF